MTRCRRALLVLCGAASLWAVAVALLGGFALTIGPIRVSSHNPSNPAVIALLSALAATALTLNAGRSARHEDRLWIQRWFGWTRLLVSATAIASAGIALRVYEWQINRPLWLDEEMMALNIRDRSIGDLAGALWLGQSAPFGWLAAQRLIVTTIGTREYALRAVPLFFGVATVLLALWAGRRWLHGVAASVFVLMCSLATWLIHYSLEVKHFSADAFAGLLLPVLAGWAAEGSSVARQLQRGAVWCAASATALWFANGAILVAPGCGLVLLMFFWRRGGTRAAGVFTMCAVVGVVSLLVHYYVAIRYTMDNEYLRAYWQSGLLPTGIGWSGSLRWLAARFEALAVNPSGSRLWIGLWVAAACGFAFARNRVLGVALATTPLSAFALAALGLVPLVDRLSLWIVPALLFGVAMCVDEGVRLVRRVYRDGATLSHLAIPSGILLVCFAVCYDIASNGIHTFWFERPRDSKQGIDDRSGVRWLMQQHRAGDVLLTTHLGLPAVWWYGGASVVDGDPPGDRLPDGSAILELGRATTADACEEDQLRDGIAIRRRALVYFGFPDQPPEFEELVFSRLSRAGRLAARRDFSVTTHAAIVELFANVNTAGSRADAAVDGCVVVQPARRW